MSQMPCSARCSVRPMRPAFSAVRLSCSQSVSVRSVQPLAAVGANEGQQGQLKWVKDLQIASAGLVLSGVLLAGGLPMAPAAQAVPQTSACATAPCDGEDFSNRDLTREFYTKGSLKGANFSNSNLKAVSMFGANLENANLRGADFTYANLGQANLDGADCTQTIFSGAIMSSTRFDGAILDGTDFTDVIIRKDINAKLCKVAKGVNTKTGVDTRESLQCF